ncbi:MAG: tetratricopeptide repeat protein [Pseudomonadales bacterium]|nr:tetratricopeptide repeat protein [Pseudomonadales bacterium]
MVKLTHVCTRQLYLVLFYGIAFSMAGCSWFGSDGEYKPEKGPILAEIIEALPQVTFDEMPQPAPTRADVIRAYQSVYGNIPDPGENQSVGKRLADLEMEIGEDNDISGLTDPYSSAINLYESLLDTSSAEQLDRVLYQLARAYDLTGQSGEARQYIDRLINEYPDSIYSVEAHFRRAEMLFSRAEYRQAAVDYKYVMEYGEQSRFARNSLYMLGWSQFKVSELDDALASFFALLEQILGSKGSEDPTGYNGPGGSKDSEAQTPPDGELLKDTMRVVVHTLSYLDGAETLAYHMSERGKPEWQYLVYRQLAKDYRDKERFLDSVATLQTFIDHNALDARSPQIHQFMIETLIDADFPSEVLPKKKEFVARYGIRSEFWGIHGHTIVGSYSKALESYLSELAQVEHASAQESQDAAAFLKAADWYEQFIETFPEHSELANYLFLSAEAYTDAERPMQAVVAYQRVVREFPDNDNAAEAGYAAVVALEQILSAGVQQDSGMDWQRVKIDAQIEFAMMFPNDVRASSVQADAADTLFSLAQYPEAIKLASHLLLTSELDASLRSNALLILGHGYFEMGDFFRAEESYRTLRSETDVDVDERILASIYKQGEAAEQEGNLEIAVHHYLRIHDEHPGTDLAIKGLHDAILVYEKQGAWDLASGQLERFRDLYPRHELSKDIPKRLASLFEKSERWTDAANEFLLLAQSDPDPEVRRTSKYRAGELFLLTEDRVSAIQHFKDYAHKYMQPKALRLEAMHQIDQLYQLAGEPDKRRFWLNKKIQLQASLGAADDAALLSRATTLAAEAQYVFAIDAREEFVRIEIKQPLKKYLKRKQKSLVKTVAAFEKLAGYQVEGYSTAATYEIAELYTILGSALMDSERPSGLSTLELEQYEILLEEQAYPFEDQAISLHELNQRRSWEGTYDEWVKESFRSLSKLMPGRFAKLEQKVEYVDVLF